MADLDRVYRELEEKTPNTLCPHCGHNDWGRAHDHIVQLVASEKAGVFTGKQSFDAVAVICNNCGYVRMHLVEVLVPGWGDAERDKRPGNDENAEEEPT